MSNISQPNQPVLQPQGSMNFNDDSLLDAD